MIRVAGKNGLHIASLALYLYRVLAWTPQTSCLQVKSPSDGSINTHPTSTGMRVDMISSSVGSGSSSCTWTRALCSSGKSSPSNSIGARRYQEVRQQPESSFIPLTLMSKRKRYITRLLSIPSTASSATEAMSVDDTGHQAVSTSQQQTRKGSTRKSINSSSSTKNKKNIDKGVAKKNLQSVDFTTALLMSRELERTVVPARIENAYQMDPYNLVLGLRTLEGNMWLHVCWHPKGARCQVSPPPPREKEQKAYTFSQTLRSLIRGLNIVSVGLARPFERVVRLDLAARLDTPPTFRLYVEIMASRSNVILVAVDEQDTETVAVCAYQVRSCRLL